jgi:hypothetical protein
MMGMSAGGERGGGAAGGSRLLGALAVVVAAAAVAGAVTVFQRPLHVDVGFLLDAAQRFLAGERLYADILEPNPPLVVYLMAIPAGLARVTGLDPVALFRAAVLVVIAGSALVAWRVGSRFMHRATAGFVAAVAAAAALLAVPGEFGQRDGLMFVLLLPYIFAAGARRARAPLPRGLAVAVGIAGGIGISLKPFFLLALAAIEGLVIVTRGPRAALRPEAVSAWATPALYAGFVAAFHREYFDIATLAAEHYGSFAPIARADLAALGLVIVLVAAWGFFLAWSARDARPLAPVLLMAAVAVTGSVILQGKGFPYHWLAPYIATSVMLALAGAAIVRPRRGAHRLLPALLLAGASVWMGWRAYAGTAASWERLERYPYYLSALSELVETHAPGEPVFSFWVAPGFPLVTYSSATWGSSFSSQWLLPSMNVRSRRGEDVSATRRFVLQAIARDLRSRRPGLLLIDREPRYNNLVGFDFLGFMRSDPAVGEALESYGELTTVGSFLVLVREDLRPPSAPGVAARENAPGTLANAALP